MHLDIDGMLLLLAAIGYGFFLFRVNKLLDLS